METTTRPACSEDTAFAREVHHLAYRDAVERQFGPWDEAQQDALFQEDWDSTEHDMLLCDGVPCGFVSVEECPGCLHVRQLVIHPDFQRRGIGAAFVRGVMRVAAARRIPVRLGTFQKNTAVEFYRKLGFTESDRTDTHVLLEWESST
jgi:GNAT superfamily N-acetyltransferase